MRVSVHTAAHSGMTKGNKMTYTNKFDSKLIETHWLAKVSHHHYWFTEFSELVKFQNSPEFDTRMTISSPASH